MIGVFKFSELSEQFEQYRDDITSNIVIPAKNGMSVLAGEFVAPFVLTREYTTAELKTMVAKNAAIVAISLNKIISISQTTPAGGSSNSIINLDEDTKKFVLKLSQGNETPKVRIAIVDTGLDSSGKDFSRSFKDIGIADIVGQGNNWSDALGHGTQVASRRCF